jgi:hypothetical protein
MWAKSIEYVVCASCITDTQSPQIWLVSQHNHKFRSPAVGWELEGTLLPEQTWCEEVAPRRQQQGPACPDPPPEWTQGQALLPPQDLGLLVILHERNRVRV